MKIEAEAGVMWTLANKRLASPGVGKGRKEMEERTKKEGTERHSGPFQGAITAGGYVFLQQLPGPKDPLAIFFFFFFCHAQWHEDPSSSTRDQTCTPCIGSSAS